MHDPQTILFSHVKPGMTVMDFGCAMGFFTIPMARMVGPAGRVIALDIQPKMLRAMQRRAARAKLSDRITAHPCDPARLGLDNLAGSLDFILAFYVMHETPDASRTLIELASLLKVGGSLLLAEPKGHVSDTEFQQTLDAAGQAGLAINSRPQIARSYTAVLKN